MIVYKSGIWRKDGLRRREGPRPRNVSYRLLKYGDGPGPEDVAVFERVIREARLAGGIYRTTYRGRMSDVDQVVGGLLAGRFPRESPLEVHDWAASDGLAASEWASRLWEQFPGCRVTASDLTHNLVEASNDSGETFIFEEGGAPLQYVRPPFVIDMNAVSSPVYPVNRWLLRRARRRVADASAAVARARWDDVADRRSFEFPPWRVERIPLLHPSAIRMAQSGAAFRLERHSVFDPLASPVAVIRTMNILNKGYFPAERLMSGICAVFESLREGGVWVVGRTVEELNTPENHATIWEKAGGGFRELARLRLGSEIAGLVQDFQVA
jgi:hypothetical protein